MASSKVLSPTTFSSGAKDELATADVYSITNNNPINSIQEIINEEIFNNANKLRSSFANATNINLSLETMAKANAEGLALQKVNELKSRLAEASTYMASALGTIPSSTLSGMLQNTNLNTLIAPITMTVNGVSKMFPGVNLPDALSMGNLINEIGCTTDAFSMYDPAAQAGMYAGIINGAYRYGIPNAFGALMSCRTDKRMINTVANNSIYGTISSGDIGSLYSMSELTSPGALRTCNPNLINDFSTGFVSPGGSASVVENNARFDTLINSFNNINPQWNTAQRGGESVLNLSNVIGGSPDFNGLMRNGVLGNGNNSSVSPLMLLASAFTKTTVMDKISESFPLTSLAIKTGAELLVSKNPITAQSGIFNGNTNAYSNNGYRNNDYQPASQTYTDIDYMGNRTVTTTTYNRMTGGYSKKIMKYDRYGNLISSN